MKVKDVERTANIAWAPANQQPIYLATGTAAQQIDATFSTNALLEIYSLNLSEPGMDMELKSSTQTDRRFHKIVWGSHTQNNGVIVGGCDDGIIQIYNASKLLRKEENYLEVQNKHKGPVHSLDFNPFQSNLLATGASESEIYIWDLNNTTVPMTPGVKSQPFEDVLSIAWNKQVQHILASTFTSKCVVWDLRKNEPIIKLMDTVSRIRWKVVAWHPEVATQLCLASEEDHAPVIQLWDLRFATSPLKTLESHDRGILSIAWCSQDADLLCSVGKDNRILCWNPNSTKTNGEVLSEIAKTNEWNFDIAWCPKNPALIACPSFDGHISIYSIMGGQTQQVQTTDKIADSFPDMDGYIQAPLPQHNIAPMSVDLSKPPKWFKRPVGASFGFGGKLITFHNDKGSKSDTHISHTVFVSQLVTEPKLVEESTKLEQALEYGNFLEYCQSKADSELDLHKKNIWRFLKANFDENPRNELLSLLGYNLQERNNKLNQLIQPDLDDKIKQNDVDNLLDFDVKENKSAVETLIKTGDDIEGLITEALLLGNTEAAVDLCFKANRYADAIIIAMTGGSDLLAKTQVRYLQRSNGYISSLISALISQDWSSVIEGCNVNSWKEALVATLTHANDQDLPKLCDILGSRLERESQTNPKLTKDAQLCYVCAGNFDKLVGSWSANIPKSADKLQELVELVTFLQKAVERQGRNVEVKGKLAELLCDYASILASQGSLNTALTYLGTSENEDVVSLRNRLSYGLGKQTHAHAYPQNQTRSRTSSRQSFSYSQNPFVPTPNTLSNQNPFNPPPANQFAYGQFNTSLPNQTITNQSWQQVATQPKTFSPPPANVPPPRPASGGSAGGSGLPSRSKYIVDPSVQSGNIYGGRTQYASPGYFNQSNQPIEPSFVPSNLPPVPNASRYEKPEVGQIAQPPPPSQPGWNDPPIFNKPPKGATAKGLVSQDPITHPLYGSAPVQELPPSNGFVDVYNPTPTPLAPPPSFNQGFNQNALNSVYQPAPPPQTRVETPAPVPKGPIPEEYKVMQITLDDLRERCLQAANNPQTKRKLEDVGRKLDVFYDLLREQKLSANTLNGLHQLVQVLQSGDYPTSLNLHTQLVSGPDFSQIASFMPGLKVLMQCALQLQVYLR